MSEKDRRESETTRSDTRNAPPSGGEMLLKSDLQAWQGIQVMVWRYPPLPELTEVVADDDVLILHLDGPVRLRRHAEGQRNCDLSVPGLFSLDPRLLARQYAWEGNDATVMHLYLAPAFLHHTIAHVTLRVG